MDYITYANPQRNRAIFSPKSNYTITFQHNKSANENRSLKFQEEFTNPYQTKMLNH